ncbi:hypothetical protein LSTR_LSTR004430 [Laodelphax striatellus]|uniref:Uncharacterized protein n=1 Tax=Laodelphax striatellus TaxID=195883 RepID=A0A482XB45_LAOST|nr:hypothetical protein LSTR_LSTR004430 [Laodelphax striatellus]
MGLMWSWRQYTLFAPSVITSDLGYKKIPSLQLPERPCHRTGPALIFSPSILTMPSYEIPITIRSVRWKNIFHFQSFALARTFQTA